MENNEKLTKMSIGIMDVLCDGNLSVKDMLIVLQTTCCLVVRDALLMCPDEEERKNVLHDVKYVLDKAYLNCEDVNEKINKKR